MKRIVIGTRGSDLALAQTRHTAAELQALDTELEVDIQIIKSKADRLKDVPLAKLGSKGVFTKELEVALLEKRIDMAVHSLKDLPTQLPARLSIGAIPERENPFDAWLSPHKTPFAQLRQNARVATSSLRRKVQLLAARPDLQIEDIRGNVPTRIAKMDRDNLDGIVLAVSGLRRLGLDYEMTEALGPDPLLPAVGQGALGIEVRSDDEALLELLARHHHRESAAAALAERALLRAMGGGCHTPLGAWARLEDGVLVIDACVGAPDGSAVVRVQLRGVLDDPEALGQATAEALREKGGERFIAHSLRGNEPLAALSGKRVLVTRAETQASRLSDELKARGAEVIELPTISIHFPENPPALEAPQAIDWVILTSVNGVEGFDRALAANGLGWDAYRDAGFCAVGPATAEALHQRGIPVELTPDRYLAEAIIPYFQALEHGLSGKSFLLPRGNLARPELPEQLRELGAHVHEVVVYETRPHRPDAARIAAVLSSPPDYLSFTSSSTVEHFMALYTTEEQQQLGEACTVASIGPITSRTLARHGYQVAIEPAEHTIPALVHAIATHAQLQ